MKRAVLAALAALLLTSSTVLATPPSDTATLAVTSIEASCEAPFPTGGRGCIHFASEPDKPNGGPNRHLVYVEVYASWALGGIAQSGTAEIDGDGLAIFFYRNGSGPSGPLSESFCAWVAKGTGASLLVPLSPVVCGDL